MNTNLQTFKMPFLSKVAYYERALNFSQAYHYRFVDASIPLHYALYAQMCEAQHFLSKITLGIANAQIQAQKITHTYNELASNLYAKQYEKNAFEALCNNDTMTARALLEKKYEALYWIETFQVMKYSAEEVVQKLLPQLKQAKEKYQQIVARFLSVIHLERFDFEADKLLMQLREYANIPNFAQYPIQLWTFFAPLDFKKLSNLFQA